MSTEGQVIREVGQRGLADLGYKAATFVAAGAEGAVFRLDERHAGKVWLRKKHRELEALRRFCDDVHAASLPFATPRIFQISPLPRMPDYWCTVEAWLPGHPLCPMEAPRPTSDQALDCVVEVVAALATVPATPAMRSLPVLEESAAPWKPGEDFHAMLRRLVRRRVAAADGALRGVLPDLDRLTQGILQALESLPTAPDCLVHGDLVPANIMVDDNLRPVAVLDFGWLSTAGASAFEAATAASFYDFVWPVGRELEERLESRLLRRLGYSRRTGAIYLAAMAIASATYHSTDPDDFWFKWCAGVLRRPELRAALHL
jgi:aminoglycoside phosphotransferase (APT) family kinase protein